MAHIAPFRALRYAVRTDGELAARLAPPYDVISPERRAALASDPHNIVHLDLPEGGEPGGAYAAAARLLADWRRDGTLRLDRDPAFVVAEQSFRDPSGSPRRRRGFFARLRLEPFEGGSVLPHERTLEAPRRDREQLLAATRTHLSAVFLLHEDASGEVARMLESVASRPPERELRDPDGAGLRLWRLAEPDLLARIAGPVGRGWTLIADGHHRYESALAYSQARRASGSDDAPDVLVYLVSAVDPGLTIGPIHRLVRGIAPIDPAKLVPSLDPFFEVESRPQEEMAAAIRDAADRPGVFGILLPRDPSGLLLRWREGSARGPLEALPAPLRRLDVVLLHRLVFQEALGLSPAQQAGADHLDYVKDEAGLLRGLPAAACGVLLNPTRLQQVVDVSRNGLRLPPKSTFFLPKVPTGIVLDPIDTPAA
ncbi:MAG TPA: DUF1015 domain-containing protein [Candidatus Polarisedimenticolia bacterium]|nr:DUF1015 domain-containing protein [Candidatus Polarisedimenticolia bacterium]